MPKRKRTFRRRRMPMRKRRRRTFKGKRKFTGRRRLTRRGGINPKNNVFPNFKKASIKFALSNILEGTVPEVNPGDNAVAVKLPASISSIAMTTCFERNVYSGGAPVVNPSLVQLFAAYEQFRVTGVTGKVYLTNLTAITGDTNLEVVLDTSQFPTAFPPGVYAKSINDTIMAGGGKLVIVPSSTGSDNRKIISFSRSNSKQPGDAGDWKNTANVIGVGDAAVMRCEIRSQDPTIQVKCHARLVIWYHYQFKDPFPSVIGNNDPQDFGP